MLMTRLMDVDIELHRVEEIVHLALLSGDVVDQIAITDTDDNLTTNLDSRAGFETNR